MFAIDSGLVEDLAHDLYCTSYFGMLEEDGKAPHLPEGAWEPWTRTIRRLPQHIAHGTILRLVGQMEEAMGGDLGVLIANFEDLAGRKRTSSMLYRLFMACMGHGIHVGDEEEDANLVSDIATRLGFVWDDVPIRIDVDPFSDYLPW